MSTIRILSWNVNGIRAVHRKGFKKWVLNDKPDVLCLQETKATLKQFPKDIRNMDDYHLYTSEAERKGYSGVATYTRLKPEKVGHGLGISKFDQEDEPSSLTTGNLYFLISIFPMVRCLRKGYGIS